MCVVACYDIEMWIDFCCAPPNSICTQTNGITHIQYLHIDNRVQRQQLIFFSRHDFCDDRFLAKAFFDVLNFKIILRFNETSHKLENYVEK